MMGFPSRQMKSNTPDDLVTSSSGKPRSTFLQNSNTMRTFTVLATNASFTKTATIISESFVDFKRKASSELGMSGWMKVVLLKGKTIQAVESHRNCLKGVAVTVESFPWIDFKNSVLVVSRSVRAHSSTGDICVNIVHQGHDTPAKKGHDVHQGHDTPTKKLHQGHDTPDKKPVSNTHHNEVFDNPVVTQQ